MATVELERDSDTNSRKDLPRGPREDLADLLLAAIRASLEAGRAILEVYRSDFSIETKDDRTPMTLADRRAHAIICQRLERTGIPILSEEGKDIPYETRKGWRRLWVVDPLDGTKEFIKRNGEFTVNIALVEENQPALGVVYAPALGLLYFAARGLGAFKLALALEGKEGRGSHLGGKTEEAASLEEVMARSARLPLAAEASARPLVVVGSRSHATPELAAYVEELRKRHGEVQFISAGSSLKFCLVAEGSADLYPRLGPTMEWDTAAGQAIAEAAGRQVLVWGEADALRYNRELLRNPSFLVC